MPGFWLNGPRKVLETRKRLLILTHYECIRNPFEWQDNCKLHSSNLDGKERNHMRAIFFRKVLIKSITLLFSVLVWGQPVLSCDDWQWDQTGNGKPEIVKVYGNFDTDLVPF